MATYFSTALGTIVGVILIALAVMLYNLGKKYINEKRLQDFILIAVRGVEQIAKNYGWDNAEKKQRVIVQVQQWLNLHGIPVTQDMLNLMIEAAVKVMKEASIFDIPPDTLALEPANPPPDLPAVVGG